MIPTFLSFFSSISFLWYSNATKRECLILGFGNSSFLWYSCVVGQTAIGGRNLFAGHSCSKTKFGCTTKYFFNLRKATTWDDTTPSIVGNGWSLCSSVVMVAYLQICNFTWRAVQELKVLNLLTGQLHFGPDCIVCIFNFSNCDWFCLWYTLRRSRIKTCTTEKEYGWLLFFYWWIFSMYAHMRELKKIFQLLHTGDYMYTCIHFYICLFVVCASVRVHLTTFMLYIIFVRYTDVL